MQPSLTIVTNAGLVLLSPLLPVFFQRVELTRTQGGVPRWQDAASAHRAASLLQIVATGTVDTDSISPALINLLCNLPLGEPLQVIQPTNLELATIDQMLKHVLSEWQPLNATSIDSLRNTFLSRQGQLTMEQEHWTLRVDRRPFDVLLSQLPWSISTTKLPWMPVSIQTVW